MDVSHLYSLCAPAENTVTRAMRISAEATRSYMLATRGITEVMAEIDRTTSRFKAIAVGAAGVPLRPVQSSQPRPSLAATAELVIARPPRGVTEDRVREIVREELQSILFEHEHAELLAEEADRDDD